MTDIDNVNVALRIRPLVDYERERGCQLVVQRAAAGVPQVVVNQAESFTFNYVFDENDSHKDIYDACVSDMLKKLLSGFNTTILAYGQTGSGKTYTMGTAFDGIMNEDVGLIPRAMCDIFERIKELAENFDFVVKCSFMELYQEQLFDLLSSNKKDESIVDLREDKSGIIVPGLTEIVVSSAQEITDYLVRGSIGRAVASTALNQESSRSHAIFTVTIIATKKDEKKSVTISKFHLVDLAGSERCTKTQATGDRFKEGVNINKGLFALGNVISALGTGHGSGYVRYRDSKLTRLLQDSLGGNSITLMIACVSPTDYNVAETLSTLRYANRARQIKNKPIVNQDPHAIEVNHLKNIIEQLRVELLLKDGTMGSSLTKNLSNSISTCSTATGNSQEEQRLSIKIKELQTKMRCLQNQLQQALHDSAENAMRVHNSEAMLEKLKVRNVQLKGVVNRLTNELTPNATVSQLQQHIDQLKLCTELIDTMAVEYDEGKCQIQTHDTCSSDNDDTGSNENSNDQIQELLQPHSEEYTNKQINFNEELRQINRHLDLKEDLHQRVCTNYYKMYDSEDDTEKKFKECEQKIEELEKEKNDLINKLRGFKDNASAKLAEERRKRLQILEQEINEMKRKNLQQAKILKVREKESQKIQNLGLEIQQMKESKVKLIRRMRQESEAFRQWKTAREKELMKLIHKDRKRENEMARQDALHSKQHNVLKRKCEEAMAINKRLKDALDRQRVAHAQRQKFSKDSNGSKTEQTIAWVDRELDLIISLIDAEHSLQLLVEDRSNICARINDIKQDLQNEENALTCSVEFHSLQEELKTRNAQIDDLQQKVCASDLETRMHTVCDGLQNIVEMRTIVKHLLKVVVQMRRDHIQFTLEREQLSEMKNRYETATKRLRIEEIKHKEEIAACERASEDKIALLLRAPQMSSIDSAQYENVERQKIEKKLAKMELLQKKLNYYKEKVKKSTNSKNFFNDEDELLSDSDTSFSTSESNDPDWTKTPVQKRSNQRKNKTKSCENKSDGSLSILDNSIMGASSSGTFNETVTNTRCCSCRNSCQHYKCGCFIRKTKCSIKCKCKMLNCKQKFSKEISQICEEDIEQFDHRSMKENQTPVTPSILTSSSKLEINNETFPICKDNTVLKSSNQQNPQRMSILNFDTPSSKRKFFN